MPSEECVLLHCGCQKYDWGKPSHDSLVAALTGNQETPGKFAELWIGTHPSLPSKVAAAGGGGSEVPVTLLSDFLSQPQHRSAFFSPMHEASEFRGEVPFLLKVLSIGKALSIQAHPDKNLAQLLHQRDPANYKDPNHKPELIVALTPFEGLCCFRKVEQIRRFAAQYEALGALLGAALQGDDEKTVLRSVMRVLYAETDAATMTRQLQRHLQFLTSDTTPDAIKNEHENVVFVRLMREQFPNDVGCWMVYILNLVKLAPGEGLFLRDSEPHAYLSGDGVEIMATSDNVVRAGLTPKFVDVPTLLSMLTYNSSGLDEAFRPAPGAGTQTAVYLPSAHVTDFSLRSVKLSADSGNAVHLTLPTCGLGICVAGEGSVNGVTVARGSAFAVTPSVHIAASGGAGVHIFIASTNEIQRATSHV